MGMEFNSDKNSKVSFTGPDAKEEENLDNLCNETIYEVLGQISGQRQLDSPTSHVVSERVQNLASQIYTELQKIINRFSDEDEIVGGLMPLIVNVLESLDIALIESQQLQVELELCKDDNEQLVSAFDKEKAIKKRIEQKLLEYEFQSEDERQQYAQKINSLENIVKMLELKAKNSADHASRLEEKEQELKTENSKLHTRYNDLLRSHCDLMERMKILIGGDDDTGQTNIVPSSNNKPTTSRKSDVESYSSHSEEVDINMPSKNLASAIMGPRQAWIDTDLSLEDASIIEEVDEIPRDREKDREMNSLTGRISHQDKYASSVTDNFFGMEKEVQNLIRENDELLATKNALNIVKDDLIVKVDELQSDLTMSREEVQQLTAVKDKLKSRIAQLEDELKKTKEELNEVKQKVTAQPQDDEEGTPMTQRKRFTRMEMARVLMERNHYKERLIELQEAIRWTELIRASKTEGEKKSVWKFLSNFFGTTGGTLPKEGNRSPVKTAIRYGTSNPDQVTPALEAMKRRSRTQHSGDLVLLMDADISSERARSLKAVRAHVPRTNGDRIMAYGWSIAGSGKESSESSVEGGTYLTSLGLRHASVPVPIYCRPLNNDDLGLKIWCAAAVDLTGGEAGFPGNQNAKAETPTAEKVSIAAIADLENEIGAAINDQNDFPDAKKLSTFAWICSVSNSKSKVNIVNIKNNPSEFLDSFTVKTHLLCIASIPGAKNNDIYDYNDIDLDNIKIVEIDPPQQQPSPVPPSNNEKIETVQAKDALKVSFEDEKDDLLSKEAISKNVQLEKLTEYVAYTEPPSPSVSDDIQTSNTTVYQPMSTCLPTMWLGGQNCMLYVHSGLAQWSHCICSVRLPDSILQIVHFKGRVFVALANGQCCIFVRSPTNGCWDFSKYLIIDMSKANSLSSDSVNKNGSGNSGSGTSSPASTATASYSIRCMEVTKTSVWLGYRNMVYILDPVALKIIHSLTVHPRKETQVRQLAAMGDGVWCSIRLDSTLRLYSALKPYQHLQDVDIEPYVSKMLSSKAFSFIRVTALRASNNRLWIGTANGVILSIPCDKIRSTNADSPSNESSSGNSLKSSDSTNHKTPTSSSLVSESDVGPISIATFIPKCNPSQSQLSYHGHKDAVKFFLMAKNLITSGGEGYIDFRLNPEEESNSLSKGDRSHLIVWELNS
ncbi:C-Jun-amino-terminal kinase-interacting protein 4 isoform X2 [Tetranychus urticae]|uniref:JNK-interacting protein 3 n=1 Tax=Tetranychus urticae TaxID=32264 RepID=T1K0G0_TETUR|nr:C-Jun-amino-terminal kinase-interacting protein 4 isoform X2 [Tetranychus urticae]